MMTKRAIGKTPMKSGGRGLGGPLKAGGGANTLPISQRAPVVKGKSPAKKAPPYGAVGSILKGF